MSGYDRPDSLNVTVRADEVARATGTYTVAGDLSKAVIVAGSGPYRNNRNRLWSPTEMNTNMAYSVLSYQGYSRDTIYYLSSNTRLRDEDGNLMVDAEATNANLEYAIRTWARGASDLLVYMVGHGGLGTFVMQEFELLRDHELKAWLDAFQAAGAPVVVIYDACHSGSFIPGLQPPAGQRR